MRARDSGASVISALASWMTERALVVSITLPSKTVPLPRTADPSTRNSPVDLTNPIEDDAAERSRREPVANKQVTYLNILAPNILNPRLEYSIEKQQPLGNDYYRKTQINPSMSTATY